MAINRVFTITSKKPPSAEYLVEIDLTKWCDSEDILAVSYTAKNRRTKETVTSKVLDTSKCTNTSKVVKPFIRGGVDGETYVVTMKVETNSNPQSKDEFYLIFTVEDNLANIGN